MKKIISIGEILMDVYSDAEVEKAEVGGASFNVSCSIGALKDNESYFMGSLGNDCYKEEMINFFHKYNIKKDFIQFSNKPTTIAKVTLDENKERFFKFIRNSDADFKLSELDNNKLKDIDFIHFGSATGFLEGDLKKSYHELFKFALDNEIKFSFDPNFRDKLWTSPSDVETFINYCDEFLKKANLIKLSDEELKLITKIDNQENALKSLMTKNPTSLICITRGCEDTMCSWNGEILYVPVTLCDNLVDTTGAGDAFISNLINEFVNRDINKETSKSEIIDIVSNSNKFANYAVRYIGAISFLDHLN
ncbi:carbohydrate kinase family protein [Spiroplasma turonicum]|uniref:Fructokinase n=1 Tax=Spiroplasma turonicum TaxID=216946 RepID=A0A0K1P730_9MOLU|nr:carbohydrate kinase [Spiroplasma turonicum]AKU79697.1 fructokinase [Spiroplasma turonicum]ALX70715.1 fructokinase [Spiroplasma turonicum]